MNYKELPCHFMISCHDMISCNDTRGRKGGGGSKQGKKVKTSPAYDAMAKRLTNGSDSQNSGGRAGYA